MFDNQLIAGIIDMNENILAIWINNVYLPGTFTTTKQSAMTESYFKIKDFRSEIIVIPIYHGFRLELLL